MFQFIGDAGTRTLCHVYACGVFTFDRVRLVRAVRVRRGSVRGQFGNEIGDMACRDGKSETPLSRAILFSSRGDTAPDMDVNYLYVSVGYLITALDLTGGFQ